MSLENNNQTVPQMPQENEVLVPPIPQENEVLVPPIPQENEASTLPIPQENETSVPPISQENEASVPLIPQENETPAPPIPQENETSVPPIPQENEALVPPIPQENEASVPSIPQENEASKPQNITIVCRTCNEVINDNETKLICKHSGCNSVFCTNCVSQMLNVMFAEPVFSYPLKCGQCLRAFDKEEIDRLVIEQNRYEQYISCVLPLFWSQDCLEINEKLVECPFCNYIEIHATDACPTHFLTCQNPSCSQRSCLVCRHAVENENDEKFHRDRCIEYESYKQLVDKAITLGSQQECPHCQLTGLKDDGCTHMTCGRCGLTWCYLCGKKEEECLVGEDDEQSLSAHNTEWEQHEGRCPQYLTSIQELDDRWPDNDRDCLEFFHRYRTLSQLYDVLKIIGEDKVNELNDNFGIIDASGYTIEEIKDYESRILINYSTN